MYKVLHQFALVFFFLLFTTTATALSPKDAPVRLIPPGHYLKHEPLSVHIREAFGRDQPVVGTYYFYWYDTNTKEHILDPDGTDALTNHPIDSTGMSYRSSTWHSQQLGDILAAGIDFILPVYWGYPGSGPNWSLTGIPPLIEAAQKLEKEGIRPPRIGMFYDTSTLKRNNKEHVDLTKPEGKEWFYLTVRDFYSMIPSNLRASIDGKPIVWLYSAGFAKRQDPTIFDYLRTEFEKDFGVEPFIVKEASWQGHADLDYSWGAALSPKIKNVVAVGPGYDDSAVPRAKHKIRKREGGNFYRNAWDTALSLDPATRPKIAIIETWNEFHEGTDIAPSREYGRMYVELTRKYADLWHSGVQTKRKGPYADTQEVSTILGQTPLNAGLTLGTNPDGKTTIDTTSGISAQRAEWTNRATKYLYFDVDNSFFYRDKVPLELEFEYLDMGNGKIIVEYDSTAKWLPHAGAFKSIISARLTDTGAWKTAKIRIHDANFAGRANGQDFRISSPNVGLTIRKVALRKLHDSSSYPLGTH
ncbi:DUF5010 domain-containing protein [Nitrosomonas communis]|uniref:DUF5010 domain-containing protein n=1 Tax=Nitrosomonas communis TaxID=44574 RepID=A0A1H2ZP09_9PROT|nr:DUF5010 domain-containing protein [Nitrosomonas communis]SDX18708.1 hypothetical protein SAMN05421882_10842 [Nitrosomonas communis]